LEQRGTGMESYKQLKERQQQEVNNFPLSFAFGDKQFVEMMAGWGLDAKKDSDLAQVAPLFGGAYILKKAVPAYKDMNRRHQEELAAAIKADETGEGFIYQMFLQELKNYEFGYTGDTSDTLESLGYTAEEVAKDPRLKRGIEKAINEIHRSEEEWENNEEAM